MFGQRVWFSPIPVAAGFLVVLAALVAVTVIDSRRARIWTRWLLAGSVLGILAITLIGAPAQPGEPNLIPLRSIIEELQPGSALGVFNVTGNIAMFVPLGWLTALVAARRRLLMAAAVGFGLSVGIELVQSAIGRVPDIDDVILNGTGAMLGAGLALVIRAVRAGRGETLPPVSRPH